MAYRDGQIMRLYEVNDMGIQPNAILDIGAHTGQFHNWAKGVWPDSAIFMEDPEVDVKRKIKKAYCPPQIVEGNPILDYCKNIIIAYFGEMQVTIKETEETLTYTDYAKLEEDFVSGKVHPSDLKPAVADAINRILQPVRDHFETGEAKALLDKIKKFKITR